MKQHITIKQAHDELTKLQYRTAVEWLGKKGYIENYYDTGEEVLIPVPIPHTKNTGGDYVFMSIGQMIEFLDDGGLQLTQLIGGWQIEDRQDLHKELCDALWEAVKEVLEK